LARPVLRCRDPGGARRTIAVGDDLGPLRARGLDSAAAQSMIVSTPAASATEIDSSSPTRRCYLPQLAATRRTLAAPSLAPRTTATTNREIAVGVLNDSPVFPILLAKDLDAAKAFYLDRLGLELIREDHDDRIVVRTGGGTQLVITKSTVGTRDSQTQMAWRVPDIHAAVAELRARGVTIEEYEAPDPVTTDGVADMGHSWAAWFIDPGGNALAIVQPKG
jgi:catechol 2,3-dioxygenase-like lactoylglutathione lyase family enzyme